MAELIAYLLVLAFIGVLIRRNIEADRKPRQPTVYLEGTLSGPVDTDIEVEYCKNHPDGS